MPSPPAALVFSFFLASQRQSYPSVSSGCCQYRDCFRGTSARSLSHAISRIVCRGPYRHLSFVERAYSPSAARRSHNPNSILPSGPNQRERRESGCYASAPVQSTWHLNTPQPQRVELARVLGFGGRVRPHLAGGCGAMAGVASFGLSRQILLRVLRATLRPCAAHRPRPHLLLRRRESSPGALRLDCARRHQLH